MRKPVTLREDKRKIALDIIADFIQSGKNGQDDPEHFYLNLKRLKMSKQNLKLREAANSTPPSLWILMGPSKPNTLIHQMTY